MPREFRTGAEEGDHPARAAGTDGGSTTLFCIMSKIPTLDILVLCALAEGPAHGYELSARMDENRFFDWFDYARSSVYQSLKRLEKKGYLNTREIRVKKSPTRTVYEINHRGKKALKDWVPELLEKPARFTSPLNVALFGSSLLDKDTVLEALREHKVQTDYLVDQIEVYLEKNKGELETWQKLIYERLQALYKAHSRWLKDAGVYVKRR